jgi:hypothetical protein
MANVDQTIEIRLDAESFAAIEALTIAVTRLADEIEKSQRDEPPDDEPDTEPVVRTEYPQVSVWPT